MLLTSVRFWTVEATLGMVRIIHEPFKEIVVLEYVQYPTPEKLAFNLGVVIRAGQPAVLNWAEGVVFLHITLPPTTETLMKHYLKGRIYVSTLAFASMPTYRSVVKVDTLEVPVIDVSPSPNLQQVARWLKDKITQGKAQTPKAAEEPEPTKELGKGLG